MLLKLDVIDLLASSCAAASHSVAEPAVVHPLASHEAPLVNSAQLPGTLGGGAGGDAPGFAARPTGAGCG